MDELSRFYEDVKLKNHIDIDILRKYALLPRVRNSEEIKVVRQEFYMLKEQLPLLTYFYYCTTCYSKMEGAIQIHHIIPIMCGGDNSMFNLIPICEACHAKIHPWLALEQNDLYNIIDGILIEYNSAHKKILDEGLADGYGFKIKALRRKTIPRIMEFLDY